MTDRIDLAGLNAPVAVDGGDSVAALVWQMVGIGVALLAAAAGLLWWHFGPVIFFDTLATLQGCF
jgi:hypothetical protein